jgi:hypothetical protein
MIDISSKYNKDLQEQRSDDKRTLYKKRAHWMIFYFFYDDIHRHFL